MLPSNPLEISAHNVETLTLPSLDEPYDPSTKKLKTIGVIVNRSLTVARLKDYLRDYGLPVSGPNRGALLERLREFSNSPEQWPSQFQPARHSVRGDISEKRAARSEVARMIEAQHGRKEMPRSHQPKRKGKAKELHEPPPLPEITIHSNTSWADEVLEQYSKHPETSSLEFTAIEKSSSQDQSPSTSLSVLPVSSPQEIDKGPMGISRRVEQQLIGVDDKLRNIQHQLQTIALVGSQTHLQQSLITGTVSSGFPYFTTPVRGVSSSPSNVQVGVSHLAPASTPTPTPLVASTAALPPLFFAPTRERLTSNSELDSPSTQCHTPGPATLQYHSDTGTFISTPVPVNSIPPEHLRYFTLDNGITFPFDKSTVPNPPGVNFTDDLSRLFQEWHSSQLLVVNGHGIPIKHWPWFYQKKTGIRPSVWGVIRMKWNNWKFIVEERERFDTEEEFWQVYSDEQGKCLNVQRVLDKLQDKRKGNGSSDANAALKFFGNDLSRPDAHGYFVYKKTGISRLMTKPTAIARQWRKLLHEHTEVAQAWEEMVQRGDGLSDGEGEGDADAISSD